MEMPPFDPAGRVVTAPVITPPIVGRGNVARTRCVPVGATR